MINILEVPISSLEFSCRTQNCLRFNSIKTLADLLELDEREILRFPNFGRKSLNEVNELLQAHGVEKIKNRRQRFFSLRLGGDVFDQLTKRALSNDRSVEAEAVAIITSGIGEIAPEVSIPERVARLERLVAELSND